MARRRLEDQTSARATAEQSNFTDSDSRIMRRNKCSAYRQSYNAQAVEDADGSYLILGARVSACASDRNELVADIAAIPEPLGIRIPGWSISPSPQAYWQYVADSDEDTAGRFRRLYGLSRFRVRTAG